jgi:hypothetical protein
MACGAVRGGGAATAYPETAAAAYARLCVVKGVLTSAIGGARHCLLTGARGRRCWENLHLQARGYSAFQRMMPRRGASGCALRFERDTMVVWCCVVEESRTVYSRALRSRTPGADRSCIGQGW